MNEAIIAGPFPPLVVSSCPGKLRNPTVDFLLLISISENGRSWKGEN
jgi:hypothetical protein